MVLRRSLSLHVVIGAAFCCLQIIPSCTPVAFKPEQRYNASFYKGMNIFLMNSRNRYSSENFQMHINELFSIGVNTIFLVTFHFSPHTRADTIIATSESVTDSVVCCAIEAALDLGLDVVLKPQVNVEDGTPRYQLNPRHPDDWLTDYSAIINRYADMSAQYDLPCFVVGTEIDRIVENPLFASQVIPEIREHYQGDLVYAASFDHAFDVAIWDNIDIIGVDAYYNLCKAEKCSQSQLVQSWHYWLVAIDRLSVVWKKPVIITEAGFVSREGCAVNPGNWDIPGGISFREQANAYEALLCQAGMYSSLTGIAWWQWELNNAWDNDSADYTPRNKEAEQVIARYWAGE